MKNFKESFLIVLFLLPLFLCAQGGWHIQNPAPLGNELTDIHVLDENSAMIVSCDGLILKTNNAGGQWDTVFINDDPLFGFKKVFFSDEDHGWVMSDILIKTQNGCNSWTIVPTFLDIYNDLYFLNPDTGFVAGKDGNKATILKTINGGQSWTVSLSDSTLWSAFSISFANDSVGFVGGYGKVFKTMNGGLEWTDIEAPILGYSVNCIYFLNNNEGFVACEQGKLAKTFDGGITWELCTDPEMDISSIHIKDMNTGWAGGELDGMGVLKHTVDGGQSWNTTFFENTDRLNAIEFSDPDHGWFIGTYGTAYYTANAGGVWEKKSGNITFSDLRAVHFINPNTGWIAGTYPSIVLKTTNGGLLWETIFESNNNSSYFQDIFFLDENNGWANNGITLFSSNDGGISWDSVFSVPCYIKSMQVLDDSKIFISQDTCVFRSLDGGINWEIVSICDTARNYSNIFFYQDHGWIIEEGHGSWWQKDIYKTDDGGMNWYLQNSIGHYDYIYFLDQNIGFGTGSSYSGGLTPSWIDKTTDGGYTWETKYSTYGYGYAVFHTICFSDELHGCAVSGGSVIFTTDGGETWQNSSENPTRGQDVFFTDPENGWLIYDYQIWKYGTGSTVSTNEWKKNKGGEALSAYPNPCSGALHLRYQNSEIRTLKCEMYSADGVLVRILFSGMQQPGQHELEIDISDLPDGLYFIRLQTGKQAETVKVVLLK